MATNVQGYNATSGVNSLTAEQAEFYQDAMLERLLPELFFMNYGTKKNIPKNAGATTSFRRLNSLAVSKTALTEGVTPDGVDLNISKITATVQPYGNWTKISEFINLTGLDPLLTEVASLMGENAGESMDEVVRDIVAAGTNVIYAGAVAGRASVAATNKIAALDVLKIRRTLKRNKVKPITLPNGKKGYLAFPHPDIVYDLMQTQEWKDQNTYVDVKNREEGIAGQMYGIYFQEAVKAPVFTGAGAGAIDVYGTLVIGDGAYGVPDVAGSSKPEMIVHKAGSGGIADPLNQFNTVAWKSVFTSARLNELCIVRYESAASL
jgi:N4-gp56 family major capsid protein